MDIRCPRKLDELPCEFCPLAVLRLKALRNSDKELTEAEEALLPGCPWAVNHQMSNYCFFNYLKDYLNDSPSDKEIAHMNNVSLETVKKIEKEAMNKIKDLEIIKDDTDDVDS
jgi:DNA-directed RNA polymerase sigma subunit (sigma70/sigma32)